MAEMQAKKHLKETETHIMIEPNRIVFNDQPVDMEKHSSPTKRLIKHKNTQFEHKKVMQDNIQRQDYSLTYCPSPGKSYVIEPHGGEIKYDLHKKNPAKFYDHVINQDITKHSVRPNKQMTLRRQQEDAESPGRRGKRKKIPLEVRSKVTKRHLFKIFNKIVFKIAQKMRDEIGVEYEDDIQNAVEDPQIEEEIYGMMKGGKI